MTLKRFHIISLIGCTLYLLGNIVFDVFDNASEKFYFVPLGFMTWTSILLNYKAALRPTIKQPFLVQQLWLFYLTLSFGQFIKFCFTNPQLREWSEYLFLAIAIGRLVFNLVKHKKPNIP